MPTCPECGHVWQTRPKQAVAAGAEPERQTSTMTDRELYAYYKRRAAAADIAFVRRAKPSLARQLDALPITRKGALQAFDLFRAATSSYLQAPNERAFWKHARRMAYTTRVTKYTQSAIPPTVRVIEPGE